MFIFGYYASVNSRCVSSPHTPLTRRIDPREFTIFFLMDGKFRGLGHLNCQMSGGWDESKVHKNAKRQLGQYPAILTELAWSIKHLLHGIKNTQKMIFELVYFRHCASINSNCALPFPRANSLEFAFFFIMDGKFQGAGPIKLLNGPRWG